MLVESLLQAACYRLKVVLFARSSEAASEEAAGGTGGEREAGAARLMGAELRGNETPPTEGRVRVRAVDQTPPTARGHEASPVNSGAMEAGLEAELRGMEADREAASHTNPDPALTPVQP